jgi:hypothetical protein
MHCSSCQALQVGLQSGGLVTAVRAASKVGRSDRLVVQQCVHAYQDEAAAARAAQGKAAAGAGASEAKRARGADAAPEREPGRAQATRASEQAQAADKDKAGAMAEAKQVRAAAVPCQGQVV